MANILEFSRTGPGCEPEPVSGQEVLRRIEELQHQLHALARPEPLPTDAPDDDFHLLAWDALASLMRAQWALGRLGTAPRMVRAGRPEVGARLVGMGAMRRQAMAGVEHLKSVIQALDPDPVGGAP